MEGNVELANGRQHHQHDPHKGQDDASGTDPKHHAERHNTSLAMMNPTARVKASIIWPRLLASLILESIMV